MALPGYSLVLPQSACFSQKVTLAKHACMGSLAPLRFIPGEGRPDHPRVGGSLRLPAPTARQNACFWRGSPAEWTGDGQEPSSVFLPLSPVAPEVTG